MFQAFARILQIQSAVFFGVFWRVSSFDCSGIILLTVFLLAIFRTFHVHLQYLPPPPGGDIYILVFLIEYTTIFVADPGQKLLIGLTLTLISLCLEPTVHESKLLADRSHKNRSPQLSTAIFHAIVME